jgi:putative redox protein
MKLAAFKIDIMGERNPTPPQFYKAIEMVLNIAGKDLDPKKIERAISLSHEKYCSVYNSLRKDMEVKVRYILEDKEPEEKSDR